MHGLNKNIHKLNKKGIIFTATIGLFLILLLIFAVIIYQSGEEGDKKLIPNSLVTQILNIEDSIQQSVKKIYLVNTNMTVDFRTDENGYDKTMIRTRLLETGLPSSEIDKDIDDFSDFLGTEYTNVFFNATAIKDNLALERGNGIRIIKTALDPSTGEKETLLIYYNYSGLNKGTFYGININISSTEDMRHIINIPPLPFIPFPSKYYLNITIDDTDRIELPYIPPEQMEQTNSIRFGIICSSFSWVINNSGNTTTYLNITLDPEKVNITVNQGNFNIIVEIYTSVGTNTEYFYFTPDKVLTIEIPKYKTRKESKISFR